MAARSRVVPIGVGVVDIPSVTKRPSGRAPGSFSGLELEWLEDALKHVMTGLPRRMDRFDDSVGVGVCQKATRMKSAAAADATRRAAHADKVQRARQQKLNEELALATSAVVDTKAAAE